MPRTGINFITSFNYTVQVWVANKKMGLDQHRRVKASHMTKKDAVSGFKGNINSSVVKLIVEEPTHF